MSQMERSDAFWTTTPPDDPALERETLVMAARSMIVARRALEGSLPHNLIADPVIDVLMALYVAHAEGRDATTADLERATPASPGVTRRWLTALAAEGLIDMTDERISLSIDGDARVSDAIRAVVRSQYGLHGPA